MNRAERRATHFTNAGRREHAERIRHICEHGNWMKTDSNGNPECPHGCGFNDEPEDDQPNGGKYASLTRRAPVVSYLGRGA